MGSGGKFVSGLGWRFAERIASQAVSFIVSIILARLLAPSDYGLISVVTVFITLANVLVSSGLGNALIQKKDADQLDFSSVFFAQLGMALLLYGILLVSAPLLASFLDEEYEGLVAVLRVLGLNIPINAIHNVQHSYVSRKMIFRKFFVATLVGTLSSAVVGLYMAYAGFGVWALVGQYLSNSLINTLVLAVVVDWRPALQFSARRLKPLISYGWKIFAVEMVNTLLNNLRALIVGRYYTSEDLAYYNKGEQFPSLIVTNINSTIQSVLFPAMSDLQNDPQEVKRLLRKMISIGSFVIFPMVYGFMAVADPVVRLLLTDKWEECIPFVQIFCISYSFRIISTSCAQSIKAMGRSDIYMKSSSVYKIIEIVSIIVTAFISVKAIAIGTMINAVVLVAINFVCNHKLLGYKMLEFAEDIIPNMLLTLAMMIVVFLLGKAWSGLPMLIIQISTGAFVYVGGAALFRVKPFVSLIALAKERFLLRRKRDR